MYILRELSIIQYLFNNIYKILIFKYYTILIKSFKGKF